MCPTCGYRSSIKARIPILVPPGVPARWQSPFERVVGPQWKEWAEEFGWDNLAGKTSRVSDLSSSSTKETLTSVYFRRAIFQGSDYYHQRYLKIREQEEPEPEDLYEFIIANVVGSAPVRVLEVGCGKGRLAEKLSKWRPSKGILAETDLDFRNIKILEGRLRRSNLSRSVLPLVCDTRKLPFPRQHFDTVVSCSGLAHVEGIDKALCELKRVLKPDGMILLAEPAFGSDLHIGDSVERLLLHGLRHTLKLHHGGEDLNKRLDKLGFTSIKLERLSSYGEQTALISARGA